MPKYVQGETVHDVARSIRIQRLTENGVENITTRITNRAMVSILFGESCVVVLTYSLRTVDTSPRRGRRERRNNRS